jgi:hypothetical protein
MATFPSEEWMEAFAAHLRAHPNAGETAEALDGVYRFVIEAAGPLTERHEYDVVMRPGEPKPTIGLVAGGEEPRLILRADYTRWAKLIRGELDVGTAVLFRRLRISGDLAGLRRQLDDVKPLTQALSAVETEWL